MAEHCWHGLPGGLALKANLHTGYRQVCCYCGLGRIAWDGRQRGHGPYAPPSQEHPVYEYLGPCWLPDGDCPKRPAEEAATGG